MADITRFDFHALRFTQSEWVQQMTDAEAGQYILLLCKAWLLGKDTTLPDNPGLLATWAHCKEVSQIVLDRFPMVQTPLGNRRRNEALYREWQETLGRAAYPIEHGKLGGSSTSEAKAEAARSNGLLGGRPANNPSETQHPKLDSTRIDSTRTSSSTAGQSSFKNLSARYRKFFGVQLAGHNKAKQEYFDACQTYGEDTVLAMFEEWAPDNQWIREKRFNYGLKQFYEGLNEQIVVREEVKSENDAEQVNLESVRAIIEAQKNETEAQLTQTRQAEIDALEKADTWF